MCIDCRKVNSVTKTDSFPVPRMDDCFDNIGQAKYVVVLLFYVHGKHLRSCRDGQLT